MLLSIYVQISWHYWEVLWWDWHVGDRRGDAHQSQLAQLCVSPAEERHPHWQLSRDAKWELSQGEILWWLIFASFIGGPCTTKAQRCGEQQTEKRCLDLAQRCYWWPVYFFWMVTACGMGLTHLGPSYSAWWQRKRGTWISSDGLTERWLSLQSKLTLCMMWTCLGYCFNVQAPQIWANIVYFCIIVRCIYWGVSGCERSF